MQLRPHQEKSVKESPNKWGLWFKMRVGKSPTAIRLISTRCKSGLVICPKSIKSQWEEEIEKWKLNDVAIDVVTRDQFRLKGFPKRDAVVVDEAHRGFANYKSQAFKKLDAYLKNNNIQYVWLLTGTPFTATPWSVYSYGILLGKNWPWYKWKDHFFYNVKMGGAKPIPLPKKGMDGELQTILRNIGTVIDLKDVAEVSDDEDIIETFKLNKQQKDKIDALTDILPIVRYTHIHQIESGVLKGNEYKEDELFDCDKDKRLLELIEDNDKIIIVCRYLAQIDKYEKIIKSKGFRLYSIFGGSKQTASEISAMANKDDKCVVIIQSDTCDGYNLSGFNTMVFVSMSYSFVNYDQIKSRMKSMDKKTPNTYIHMLTEGDSMDRAVYDSVSKKQDFSIQLYSIKNA